jgi:hypothetical protein
MKTNHVSKSEFKSGGRGRVGGSAVIVLDTHALVWWVGGDSALSKKSQGCD